MYVMRYTYTFAVIIKYSLSILYIWCAVLKVLVTQLCISFGNGHDRVGDLATYHTFLHLFHGSGDLPHRLFWLPKKDVSKKM